METIIDLRKQIGFQFLVGLEILPVTKTCILAPRHAHIRWVLMAPPIVVKRPEPEEEHSPSYSFELKNVALLARQAEGCVAKTLKREK
jgi:hypothetical protein